MEKTEAESTANLALLLGSVLVLAGLSLAFVSRDEIASGASQSADYHRAPGCTPTAAASSGLPPCQFRTMTVTSKNQTDGGDAGPDAYALGLRLGSGAEEKVTLVGPSKADLFAHVAVGGSVQVKTWQGQILILSVPGWHCGTPDHPDAQLDAGEKSAALGGGVALLGGLGTWLGWRVHRKKQPSKDVEENN